MLADIESNESLPADELQLCPQRKRTRGDFPDERRSRRRIVATVQSAEGGDAPHARSGPEDTRTSAAPSRH